MDVSILDGPVAQRLADSLELVAQRTSGITINCEGFKVSKVFPSISEMEAYTYDDIQKGDFVIISSNDSDNGKIYIKTDDGYSYGCTVLDFKVNVSYSNAEAITNSEIQSIFQNL